MDDTESSKQISVPDPISHEEDWWVTTIMNADPRTTTRVETSTTPGGIQVKIPKMQRDTKGYEKYFVPRHVSLGPYHHGNPNLQFIQDLKPCITKRIVKGDEARLRQLYRTLHNMIMEVKKYYELEYSTNRLSDNEFTTMMLDDGCFILFILSDIDDVELGLESHHMDVIKKDLFLLENQVPYIVLQKLCSLVTYDDHFHDLTAIRRSIKFNNFMVQKEWWSMNTMSNCWGGTIYALHDDYYKRTPPAHILGLLQRSVAGQKRRITRPYRNSNRYTFHNVNELLAVGITFRPSKTSRMADIQFKSCGLSAYLELPAIRVDESTRCMLLNLVAYEMFLNDPIESWVTSYVLFLNSLIDGSEDVKEFRKAGILDNRLGSDEEVAKLFKEISTELVSPPFIYDDVKYKIQNHYDKNRRVKTWATEFKHDYFKSPWSALALVGAIFALFLGAVQAYFSVWPVPGDCDALCKYLKLNHHL